MSLAVDGTSDGLRSGHPVAAAPEGISGPTGHGSSGQRQEDFNVRIESGSACNDGDCHTFAVSGHQGRWAEARDPAPEFLLIR